jgi:hypothetical protein
MMNKKTEQRRNACVGQPLETEERALLCNSARFFGCFRLRWMASSSAEASSYAQGFGVTRRRDQPSLRLPPTRKASA